MTRTRRPFSYLARALLGGAVLYFAFVQSASDRGVFDYVVIALLCGAIGWNAVQLSRRMMTFAGGRAAWHVQRTLLFWVVGLMNTVGAKPLDWSRWTSWVGVVLLVSALCDTVTLARREREAMHALDGETPPLEAGQ